MTPSRNFDPPRDHWFHSGSWAVRGRDHGIVDLRNDREVLHRERRLLDLARMPEIGHPVAVAKTVIGKRLWRLRHNGASAHN
jgi:hypothetical protein